MVEAYVYDFNGNYKKITELLISLKYKCSLEKPCQEVTFEIPYGVYSDALPSFYIATGCKFEMYEGDKCIFKGKVETTTISADEEKETVVCYDYIRVLMKSKVCYNFKNITAFDAVCQIFNDLEIPYSTGGILGGESENAIGKMVNINHLIKNKSAYDACMMIATELHTQFGSWFYMFMDVAGNVNLMECDRYWSRQTIEPCSDPSLRNPDGNMISFKYSEDASDVITRVLLYSSKGGKVDINTGESYDEDEEEFESSNTGSGKTIGIDMGHNYHCGGASGLLDETDENRVVGNKVISVLEKSGYTVVNCTDEDGTTESQELKNRTNKANNQELDLFISIHFNAGGGNGTEIYYNSKCNSSMQALANTIGSNVANSCDFNYRGCQSATYYVLKNNKNPAMLLEVCFVDSSTDKQRYNADKVAKAIVNSIKGGI